jgi:hypothetical protein
MTYACPAWEFAADSHQLKLQHLQSRVLRTTGNLPRRTPTRALHLAFQIPYVYNNITEIYRKQAEVIQNHDTVNVRNTGKIEAQHRKYKRLKLGGGQAYDRSVVYTAVNIYRWHNVLRNARTDRPGMYI